MITSVTTGTHLRVFPRFFLCYRLYFESMPRERVSAELGEAGITVTAQSGVQRQQKKIVIQ